MNDSIFIDISFLRKGFIRSDTSRSNQRWDMDLEMIYLRDLRSCYIKRFKAVVISIGSEGGDFIVLDRTAFYPHGGGQPSDTGTLSWKDGSCRISSVKKKGTIMHFTSDVPPGIGTEVEGIIDWEERYKNMRMHTAQHLLSSVVWRRHKAKTVGNQIHPDRSRIDFHPLKLDDGDTKAIEEEVNRLIDEGHDLSVDFKDRRFFNGLMDVERLDMDRLPPGIEVLRTVSIGKGGTIDICPCAGTHVENLKELGRLRITNVESKGKERMRIEYVLEGMEWR
jgi:misacylated tRNA(Ala) deacylase